MNPPDGMTFIAHITVQGRKVPVYGAPGWREKANRLLWDIYQAKQEMEAANAGDADGSS